MKNNDNKDFINNKKTALKKLNQAKKQGLVDLGVMSLLDIINQYDNYYTSSSCAGRIVILELPEIGDKKNAEFLGKWHTKIQDSHVLSAVKKANKGQLWFLAQSSIIHIGAKTQLDAEYMLKTAVSSGFKNSGIKSLSKKIIVEICSTERFDVPIGKNGLLFCDEKYISLLVGIANDMINRSVSKLTRLESKLKKKI